MFSIHSIHPSPKGIFSLVHSIYPILEAPYPHYTIFTQAQRGLVLCSHYLFKFKGDSTIFTGCRGASCLSYTQGRLGVVSLWLSTNRYHKALSKLEGGQFDWPKSDPSQRVKHVEVKGLPINLRLSLSSIYNYDVAKALHISKFNSFHVVIPQKAWMIYVGTQPLTRQTNVWHVRWVHTFTLVQSQI